MKTDANRRFALSGRENPRHAFPLVRAAHGDRRAWHPSGDPGAGRRPGEDSARRAQVKTQFGQWAVEAFRAEYGYYPNFAASTAAPLPRRAA